MEKMKVKVTFFEEVLGTSPADKEVYETFIGKNAPDAKTLKEEISDLGEEEVIEKAMTVFPKLDDGRPFSYDYQWKGYFKDACGMLRRADGTKSRKLTAYKKVIDGLVFPGPRKIPFKLPDGGELGICQRPLRAETMQGPRVALSISETVPSGSSQIIEIKYLKKDLRDLIIEWLDYGELHGHGQWRNSGKGRFTYEILEG